MLLDLRCECGFAITASKAHSGMSARCTDCGRILTLPGTITPPDTAQLDGATDEVAKTTYLCSACGEVALLLECVCCRFCKALYHLNCFTEKGGCTVPACEAGPRKRKKIFRPANTKDALKACPTCAESIPERAHRCRYCGEYTDPDKRYSRRHRTPTRTSNLAGISLISGLINIILMMAINRTPLYLLAVLLPFAGLGLGIWGVVDIKAAAGSKSGIWVAGIGVTFNAIALLTWLVNVAG